jgi:hypothetical protein
MAFNILTIARRWAKISTGAPLASVRATAVESLAIASVEPYNAETARAGRRFGGGCQALANGMAPVSTIPTTTATMALYNGEAPGSGRVYYIDRLLVNFLQGTPAAGLSLYGCLSPGPIATAPSMATNWGISSCSGSTQRSKGVWGAAVTLPSLPSAPVWVGLSAQFQLASSNVGQGDNPIELAGAWAIPPGYAMGFALLSGAGTSPLYGLSATWVEIENASELE